MAQQDKPKKKTDKTNIRAAFIAGAKYAFEAASIKIGINFGNPGKEKDEAFKSWYEGQDK